MSDLEARISEAMLALGLTHGEIEEAIHVIRHGELPNGIPAHPWALLHSAAVAAIALYDYEGISAREAAHAIADYPEES
jgi:hypothetical protein